MNAAFKILGGAFLVIVIASVFIFTGGNKKKGGNTGDTDKKEKKSDSEDTGSGKSPISIAKVWEMPADLLEISAVSWIDGTRFACVQDETGKIYIYNTASSTVEKEIDFGKTGDYEGIAIAGANAYVWRADGKIFEILNYNQTSRVIKEYQTHLSVDEDSESMCYDKANNRLLISVKAGDPNSDEYKGIYAFDLKTKTMAAEPVLKIDLADPVFEQVETGKKKKKKGGSGIQPSDIAIHPTGDIYVLEGTKPKLMIMDSSGKIKQLYQLDNSELIQPEGITFNAAGDLFISSEGSKTKPGILAQVTVNP